MCNLLPNVSEISVCTCIYTHIHVYIYMYSWSSLFMGFLLANLGFPWGSVGKESAYSEGNLSSIPGLGGSPGEGKGYPTPVSWPGEFHRLYSPWGHKELDMTEWLSLSFIITWKFIYSLKLLVTTKSAFAVLLQSFIDMYRVWKLRVIQCALSSGCWPSDALPCSSQIANKCHFHSV